MAETKSTKTNSIKKQPTKKGEKKAPIKKKSSIKKSPSAKKSSLNQKKVNKKTIIVSAVSIVCVIITGIVAFFIIKFFNMQARNGVYCREQDEKTYCIIVDNDNVDFGKTILTTRAITGKIGAGDMISFPEDDKKAYEEACKKSWFCYDEHLDDKKIIFGDGWITIDNIRLNKSSNGGIIPDNSNSSNESSSSTTKLSSPISDSGNGAGDSKIFNLPAGKYSIKYDASISWSNPNEDMGDISFTLKKCTASSSYCSYTKSFYTNYFHRDKNETSLSKSTTFEVDEDGDYKIEVNTYDDFTIVSWNFTIDSL